MSNAPRTASNWMRQQKQAPLSPNKLNQNRITLTSQSQTTQQMTYPRDQPVHSPEHGYDSDSNPEYVNVGAAIGNQRFERDLPKKAKSTGPFMQPPVKGDQQMFYQNY